MLFSRLIHVGYDNILQYRDSYIVLTIISFQTLDFKKIVLDACSRKLTIKYDEIIRKDKKVVASREINICYLLAGRSVW